MVSLFSVERQFNNTDNNNTDNNNTDNNNTDSDTSPFLSV